MRYLSNLQDGLARLQKGMADAYGEGREDNRIAFKRAREDQGLNPEATRIETSLGTNRTFTMMNDLMNRANPAQTEVYNQMGMGLSDDAWTRTGQILGHFGADLTQDRSRELWWLLNAPQAVGNVLQELAVSRANPTLYNTLETVLDSQKNPVQFGGPAAIAEGAVDAKTGRLKKGYSIKEDEQGNKIIQKRKYDPGFVDALQIPTGLAINSGIGLMNPFGGQEGYAAAVPSEEDKSKTDNPLMEVASKYILGRTGNLLPWDEFRQVRPDVSKDEYMAYKAFKFDKNVDVNPFDDGQTTLPGGVIKTTNEGIHGPEVQFLGRSLPVTTALIPTAIALGATAAGVKNRRAPVRTGFAAGMGGALGGMAIGNAIEEERRRRNAAENGLI